MAIAYFSTWTTYGTWLPGDQRGWFERSRGLQSPDPFRELESMLRMTEAAIVLDAEQRRIVEQTIADHCQIRKWTLHCMNCRTNHVHVLTTAVDRQPKEPREQFKAWCTRRLKDHDRMKRAHWWTERGWDEYIDDENSLVEVMSYIMERQ
jgi:REP element-mobilizing transposase RayT